ncbi:MAG: PKD domain-containing protein, partial [bacterium]|nr:PKD domain-containing protein [bacterium]
FTDTSTGSITSWSWDFGDGGISSDSRPTHTYQTTSPCTVTLVVSGPCGTDTETRVAYINPVAAPQADFTASTTTPCSGTAVTFTDTSTGSITSWSWNFGDGGISSDSKPAHTYRTISPCTVTLVVSGPCGTDTETRVAYINPVAASHLRLILRPQRLPLVPGRP